MMKRKLVVYTAITGGYDELRDPSFANPAYDYVCFTDRRVVRPGIWNVRPLPAERLDRVRKARHIKILPHLFFPEYEYSVWVDANVDITGDIDELLTRYAGIDFLCFRHPDRDCIYKEGEVCVRCALDRKKTIQEQLKKYRSERYPAGQGLIEDNVLIRRHKHPSVIGLMEDWWKEIVKHSLRDQLSFNYVAWKREFHYETIGDDHARPGGSAYFVRRGGHRIGFLKRNYRRIISKYRKEMSRLRKEVSLMRVRIGLREETD